jgi:SagB-type dehydrogenase family enzyme
MKRLIVLLAVLICLVDVCAAQPEASRRTRTNTRNRTAAMKVIQLAEPKTKGTMSLEEALQRRRSVRFFTSEPLKFSEIAQLAWAGQGVTDLQRGLRTAPSAGALYPIDLYFSTTDGLFVYRPANHSMEQVIAQDIKPKLMEVMGGPEAVATAGCNIIVAGSSRKLSERFRDKSKTYMLLEAGHIAQNIQLQAVCLGLGSVTIGGMDSRQTSRVCRLPTGYEVLYVIPVGHPGTQTTPGTDQDSTTPTENAVQATGKTALFIVPSQGFQDDELFQAKRALDLSGVRTVIASRKAGPVQGMLGNQAQAMLALNQVRVEDFDAIIFVGGPGAEEYFEDPLARSIAREAVRNKKILGATSIAPTILAGAGVLTGVRVTGFVSEKEKLQQAGAIYMGLPVERDGNIITSSGPMASPDFARALAAALAGR